MSENGIEYVLVGDYYIPLICVEEETRDIGFYGSLRRNYLRRKANGKQKEYEDKVKEKRKAEIEAKKEAIRQEDIAKGVFVPVSMLPAAEPKKGVANA